jgi:hypothetical protein
VILFVSFFMFDILTPIIRPYVARSFVLQNKKSLFLNQRNTDN